MSETFDGVDFTDVSETPIDGPSNGAFSSLSTETRNQIVKILRSRHADTAVNGVLGPLRDWKLSSYANYARTHERAFKRACEGSAPERDDGLLARDPTDAELEVVGDVRTASRRFVEAHFETPLTVYRGITYAVPELMRELFEAPETEEVPLQTTVLTNVTTVRPVAADYGTLVVRADAALESIAVAADGVFGYERHGERVNPEGELRLLGEQLGDIDADDVQFPSSARPFRAGIRTPESLTRTEHETVEDVLTLLDDAGTRIEATEASEIVWTWFDVYRRTLNFENRGRLTTVDGLVQRVFHE